MSATGISSTTKTYDYFIFILKYLYIFILVSDHVGRDEHDQRRGLGRQVERVLAVEDEPKNINKAYLSVSVLLLLLL